METPPVRAAAIFLLPLLLGAATVDSFPFPFFPFPDGPYTGGGQSDDQASGQSPYTGGRQSDDQAIGQSPGGGLGSGDASGSQGSGGASGGGGAAAAAGGRGRKKSRDLETDDTGGWELFISNSGVSAMHLGITNQNKAIIFDATNFGPSQLKLPEGPCRFDQRLKQTDCYAHALELDIETAKIRPLQVVTNPWCASGGFAPDGSLVQTGGWWEGGAMVRYLGACDTCDFKEFPDLARKRWYATQQILPDGGFIVIGGRREFNYEYVPPHGKPNGPANVYQLPLLRETNHPSLENNLYPFVHLAPDGNLFIFANNMSILLDHKNNKVIREFPPLKGGARNYPASGMSVLLPLNLNRRKGKTIAAEVVVCGGSPPDAMKLASDGQFDPVLSTCGRLLINKPNTDWKIEVMPKPRIMADMLLLPNGEVLLINGASKGAAGWLFARDPVFEPWLYRPQRPRAQRFKVLQPSKIPRLYHSSSALLPDGKILVAGSNPNNGYNFTNVMYPTELRVEKFAPPYLDPALASHRPEISEDSVTNKLTYGQSFMIVFKLPEQIADLADIKVTMYAQPFTTHGYSMNQRLLILKTQGLADAGAGSHKITVEAPPSGELAPPGYYLMFVVYRGVPSKGMWVHIQ